MFIVQLWDVPHVSSLVFNLRAAGYVVVAVSQMVGGLAVQLLPPPHYPEPV